VKFAQRLVVHAARNRSVTGRTDHWLPRL